MKYLKLFEECDSKKIQEIQEYEITEGVKNPNDNIKMKITYNPGLFNRIGDRDQALKALAQLAKTCKLEDWKFQVSGREFILNITGKRAYCDIFYKAIERL